MACYLSQKPLADTRHATRQPRRVPAPSVIARPTLRGGGARLSARPAQTTGLKAQASAVDVDVDVDVKRASGSKSGVDVAPPEQSEDVLIKLKIVKHAAFGQIIKVVGAPSDMGSWDAKAGLALQWTEGDHWVGELRLPAGKYEYKAVVFDTASGYADWESGANHVLEVPSFPGVLEVDQVWNTTALTTRFTDAARPVIDPIELAAQKAAAQAAEEAEAAAANAAVTENKLASLRKTIQEDVQRIRTSDEPAAFSAAPADLELDTPAPASAPSSPAPAPASAAASAPAAEAPVAVPEIAPATAEPPAVPETETASTGPEKAMAAINEEAVLTAPAPAEETTPQVEEEEKSTPAPVAEQAPAVKDEVKPDTTTTEVVPVVAKDEMVAEVPEPAPTLEEAVTEVLAATPAADDPPLPASAPVTPSAANNVVPAPPGVSEASSNGSAGSQPAPAAPARKAAIQGGPALVGDLAETPAGKALNELWGFLANGGRR